MIQIIALLILFFLVMTVIFAVHLITAMAKRRSELCQEQFEDFIERRRLQQRQLHALMERLVEGQIVFVATCLSWKVNP